MLTDKTLEQWSELAKRDDACNLFVPSDIRQLIGEVRRLRNFIAQNQPPAPMPYEAK